MSDGHDPGERVEPSDVRPGDGEPAEPGAPEADVAGAGAGPTGAGPLDDGSVDLAAMGHDELVAEVVRVAGQRDDLHNALQHTQADFENYRKRSLKQQADAGERAAGVLVEQLLPILDACDGAIRHDAKEVEPIYAALLGALEKAGLERIDPGGEGFDPNRHEAVLHEPAADGDDESVVSDVMRPGYAWRGRVIRPAMVKVRG